MQTYTHIVKKEVKGGGGWRNWDKSVFLVLINAEGLNESKKCLRGFNKIFGPASYAMRELKDQARDERFLNADRSLKKEKNDNRRPWQ